ncbi:ATP-dependent DNA helicase Q-like SIM isoform X2 [Punica granatum]|uniref:DNA 3'-5' helicase n=1 Tax=Punica granatum TaxID=22663 RepID=A0A6P8C669_PUNGR|nr:ATP-dependent DNA helicase Q-like SIM isoform X2 [Punica granatum]
MDGEEASSELVVEKLVEMGFEYSSAKEAVETVGSSVNDAADYILNGARRSSWGASTSSTCSTMNKKALGKRSVSFTDPPGKMRQSSILDHFRSNCLSKRNKVDAVADMPICGSDSSSCPVDGQLGAFDNIHAEPKSTSELLSIDCSKEHEIGPEWGQKVNSLLQKRFGHSSLKGFQKEALAAWIAHQDCLVLAATGSGNNLLVYVYTDTAKLMKVINSICPGKSMCFQIPALLTGKVVVVISPLISLMHDQCLKLANHGVSACFLGSGQPDNTVEQKAMKGMYDLIYVCPETVLRLIAPLQKLAAGRGIALFAIDEVHCVSKWGHDFRPDYRRLSVLRENFSTSNLKFLQFDIPLMALTATATNCVREDIIECLCMSKETKIVLTSFFRSNLRFSVKHSRTSSPASYRNDFLELINTYSSRKRNGEEQMLISIEDLDDKSRSSYDSSDSSTSEVDEDNSEVNPSKSSASSKKRELTVEFLEDETDVFQDVNDWDVSCGEFGGQSNGENYDHFVTLDAPVKLDERMKLQQESLGHGPTIIYVPTRKETVSIAKFLCQFGIKAAAYNARLPKSHLRRVHKEFHENHLEVVVATVAFGMGIDKLNVRRIIHYGWPQSLEAYYQEAGRAGRDGKLADCILYANLSKIPTLLPSKRSEDQVKQAYKMLSDCHRYGMNTSWCRAKILVEYFGEDFSGKKCLLCDVCVKGPPEIVNVKAERQQQYLDGSYDCYGSSSGMKRSRYMERPNLRTIVSKIREQTPKFMATDMLWWRGLARIVENKGYVKEGDNKVHVQIKYPELTKKGMDFIESEGEEDFYIFPEADMLLSVSKTRSFSTFQEWGKGWADPEIRRQRLERKRTTRNRKPRKGKWMSKKLKSDQSTVRGRLAAKLTKASR